MCRRADIPLAEFRLEAHNYEKNIQIAWNATSDSYEFFNQEEEILPDQCDVLKKSILILRNPVQDFCRLLDTPSDLPMDVVPFRYSLIMALHRIDYLANDLIMLITLYRMACHTTSREMIVIRKEINSKLCELTKTIEDIPQIIGILLFQARYYELAG